MTQFPFTISPQSITVFVNGVQHIVPQDHSGYQPLYEHLKEPEHDASFVEDCADKTAMLGRLTAGKVTVVGSTVYFAGNAIHSALTDKLLNMLDAGFDATPWANFMNNLHQNRSENSIKSLYNFLNTFNAPFTPDGGFIVFKRVRADYKDIHSGTFDNSPGTVVQMPWEEVEENPDVACAQGLHVCSIHYLGSAYGSGGNYKTVACKVMPQHVVSVPKDYNFSKMRVCEYTVIGDVDEEGSLTQETVSEAQVLDIGTEKETPKEVAASLDNWEEVPDKLPAVGDYVTDGCGNFGEVMRKTASAPYMLYVEWEAGGKECIHLTAHGAFGLTVICPRDEAAAPEKVVFDKVETCTGCTNFTATNGEEYTACEVEDGVRDYGQRGYSNQIGVPRSTLQGWIEKIKKHKKQ